MAYIGRQLVRGQNRIYDDISSSFNGSTTAFNLTIGGDATPPAQVNQLWIVLGGILQKPGTDFTVADAQVTFTTAPAAGLDFWAMIQGDTSDMNAPSDGSVTPTKIATSGDFAFPADVRFKDADGSHYVGLQAPTTVSSNLVWTLPAADGSANQYLKTNGSGVLGWASDTQSNLLDEDNMSSNSATQPASQQSIKAYADTKAVLTGSTNNTITTVTGAHAIQGEANLTYDGSHLAIATDAHGEGIKLTASGSTYNGITFDANRSGADEYMGALEAKWNGSLVSFISFETGADTTNKDDGLIAFSTRESGQSIAERMRILSGGQLCLGTTSGPGEVGLYLGDGTNPAGHIYANGTHHLYLLANAYYSSGWKYLGNGEAQSLSMQDGAFVFLNAAANSSGAGQAITLTERLKIDSSGNMGLGVTPSGWATNGDFKGLQVGTGASIFGRGSGDQDRGGIAVNYYHDGSNDKYIANGNSNQIYMNDGNINFRYAAANSSGAGANITWIDTLYLKNDGTVGIGTTSPSSGCQLTIASGGLNITGQNTSHGVNSVRIGEEGSGKAQIRAYGSDASSYGSLEINLSASDGSGSNNVMEFKKASQGASLCFPSGGGIIARGANASTYGELSVEVAASDLSGSNNVATFKKLASGISLAFPSGGGIDFSATGGPDSGSGSSELLDDYEEGTFTPTWGDGNTDAAASNITYSQQTGYYNKVGRIVHISLWINHTGNTNSSTGNLLMNLPFTSANISGYRGGMTYTCSGLNFHDDWDDSDDWAMRTHINYNKNWMEVGFGCNLNGATWATSALRVDGIANGSGGIQLEGVYMAS